MKHRPLFPSPQDASGSLSHWHTGQPRPSFSRQLPSHADCVVVGGGWVGASTCYWLARAGVSVVLLERALLTTGATGRNAGFISIGPEEAYDRAIARLGQDTAHAVMEVTMHNRLLLHHLLAEEDIDCEYREPGHLHLVLNEAQWNARAQQVVALQRDQVSTTLLERRQVQELIHTPLAPSILGGQFVAHMGLLHPIKLLSGLLHAAQRVGARLVLTTVQQIAPDGAFLRLQTTEGTISTEHVIVAVNAWTDELLPHLRQVIIPVRGQMISYQVPSPVFSTGVTVDLDGSEDYWQQTPDGTVILGGCRSAAHGRDWGVRLNQPSASVQQALEQVFPRLFPQLAGFQVHQRWAGSMAFTPDFLPIADRIPDIPRSWVVGGFCGHGMPFGLRLGQLMAEAVTTNQRPASLLPFGLDRATLNPPQDDKAGKP